MNRSAGFTLVELIMTMIIIGILAAVAIPRFFDTDVFRARGFADEVQATLRYAQKVAIAQHRLVCVAVTTSPATVALTIASSNAATSCPAEPCAVGYNPPPHCLNLPTSDKNFVRSTDDSLSIVPVKFAFNALGSPFTLPYTLGDLSAAQEIKVTDYTIKVEKETGYVHQ